MEGVNKVSKRKPGRPLGFDRDAALYRAMLLFWQHGYEATSVNDLIQVMGITPPSLYTAFGDKKRLFLEALDRYLSGPVTSAAIIAGAPDACTAAEGFLKAAAVGFTGSSTPAGCLLASSAISCSPGAADVQRALARKRLQIGRLLLGKMERDPKLADERDLESLAGHIMAVIQGMSTLARDGASRRKLLSIVDVTMRSWPAQSA